jgi:PAS domain S-box-containing protein
VSRSPTDLSGLHVNAEDFLAAVVDTLAQPVWVVDPGGVIRFANPAALATLGYDSADDLVGRDSHQTIHCRRPDGTRYPAEECPMLLPRLTGERVASDLDWLLRRDGSMFPVSYVSVPLDMPDGRGAVVAFTDIEDRLRAERELRDRTEVLAAEQSAHRRVAALVARGVPAAELFGAVAREVGLLLDIDATHLGRYERDGTASVIASWSRTGDRLPVGTRVPDRWRERLLAGPADGTARAHGQLRGCCRADRRDAPRARHPLLGGRPHRRLRAAVGRGDRLIER